MLKQGETKVALINPPLGNIMQPYIGLASLQGHLRRHGVRNTKIWDVSQTIVSRFMTPAHVEHTLQNIEQLLARLEHEGLNNRENATRYENAVLGRTAGRLALAGIEDALRVLRSSLHFYDAARYHEAMLEVDRVFMALSGLYYPQHIDRRTYTSSTVRDLDAEGELKRFITDPKGCLFHPEFERDIAPAIINSEPDVMGLGISYESQFIPALVLATICRHALPELHIVIGGGFLSDRRQMLNSAPWLFDIVDSIILNEGETPLLALIRRLESRDSLDDVPNLLRRIDGEIAASPTRTLEDLTHLGPPDYDGYEIRDYLSPSWDILYDPTRGCYWNRCNFCAISTATKGSHRQREATTVVDHLERLCETHESRVVTFSVDAIPVPLMREIAKEIIRRSVDISWTSEFILDKRLNKETIDLFAESGCMLLMFGLESASPRITRLMKKGTTPERSARIIRDTSESGIGVLVHLMLGYPTETHDEFESTMRYIEELSQYIDLYEVSGFLLNENAAIQSQLSSLGITNVERRKRAFDTGSFIPFAIEGENDTSTRDERVRHARRRLNRTLALESSPYLTDDGPHIHLYLRHTGTRPRDWRRPCFSSQLVADQAQNAQRERSRENQRRNRS